MQYDITLAIRYRYEHPATAARMVLRMQPLNTARQRLLSGGLTCTPQAAERRDERDFFGNALTALTFAEALSEVTFRFAGRVACFAGDHLLDLSPPLGLLPEDLALATGPGGGQEGGQGGGHGGWPEQGPLGWPERGPEQGPEQGPLGGPEQGASSAPLVHTARPGPDARNSAGLGPASPHHFMGASERVSPGGEIGAFAREVTNIAQTTLQAVEAVSAALHDLFEFDATATDVATDPAQAFAQRRGVCQDISHVMIGALRAVGVPAGYVSGFLRTQPPAGQPRLEGADAMHAWVRAWCGRETGWVEIDPTNNLRVGTDHVAVAYGRDYADVSPVKGTLRSAGPHATEHSVDMVPMA